MAEIKTRMKILLDTESDLRELVNIASSFPASVSIKISDTEGMCVNAKSVIGVMYAMTFTELWLESNENVYSHFNKFAAE